MSSNSTDSGLYELSDSSRIIIGIVLGVIVVVGIFGNLLVVALIMLVKKMRSVVNLSLASLALADLMVLAFLPITLYIELYKLTFNTLGTNLCVFILSIDRSAVVCSTLIFMLVGIERYTVLCHPLKTMGMWTMSKVGIILVVIWIVSIATCLPYGYTARYRTFGNSTRFYCYTLWNTPWLKWYEMAVITTAFFLPIPILVLLYGKMIIRLRTGVPESDAVGVGAREARKARYQVVMMLVSVIVIFVVCHVPFRIYNLIYVFDIDVLVDMDREALYAFNWTGRLLQYINHAANPVIYFSLSSNFREAFKVLCCKS